jgi:D-glycero-alpha-D-manno-heptose 1-phosphate guanylyltransferase
MECIILAGGQGTRLQSVIGGYPKCMAPVNDKPFLHYLFEYLSKQQCERVILSLGYKHEVVTEWLQTQQLPFGIDHVIETEALGTGGGIALAMTKAQTDDVAVLNGDTMFQADMNALYDFHKKKNAATTLALKEMHQFERYGVVNINEDDTVTSFEEKQYRETGLINGGVYIISKPFLFSKQLPEKFSFEKDYLERFVHEKKFFGFRSSAYFIDIGIPVDYEQSKEDFKSLFR